MIKFLKIILGLSVLFAIGSSLLFCNILQASSLVFYFINREWVYGINQQIVRAWWIFCAWSLEKICGIEFILTGSSLPEDENAIVIANHQCMSDILVILWFAWKKQSAQKLKWFAKEKLKWLPGIGWGLIFLDSLLIKRNWTSDKYFIERMFRRYREQKIPFWIISFLEGTRATPKKLEMSKHYAKRKGIASTQYVLIPRTKGFFFTLDVLRGLYTAVYDITIAFEKRSPTVLESFLTPPKKIHLHVRRYPITEIPQDETNLNQWTYDLYQEKDALLRNFHNTGRFI